MITISHQAVFWVVLEIIILSVAYFLTVRKFKKVAIAAAEKEYEKWEAVVDEYKYIAETESLRAEGWKLIARGDKQAGEAKLSQATKMLCEREYRNK